ncbi:hypothetical protein [Actinoplanes sp. NPDC049316]|uniref:hypothetical protein n=1 Tax=Actinoplanes sp. NPDC049316 TaxID=3154727 RepID=UPI003427337C
MTDEPLPVEAEQAAGDPAGPEAAAPAAAREPADDSAAEEGAGGRENKGSPGQPWKPGEQPYSDRPEQDGETPGPAKTEPSD